MSITTRIEGAIEGAIETTIYTTDDGFVAIEQVNDNTVLLSSDQLVAVIRRLETCYDNRAYWHRPTQARPPPATAKNRSSTQLGIEKTNVAPGPSFWTAQRRPP